MTQGENGNKMNVVEVPPQIRTHHEISNFPKSATTVSGILKNDLNHSRQIHITAHAIKNLLKERFYLWEKETKKGQLYLLKRNTGKIDIPETIPVRWSTWAFSKLRKSGNHRLSCRAATSKEPEPFLQSLTNSTVRTFILWRVEVSMSASN